jgi:glycerophosphoryl diester phosphodiesterase
LEHLSTVSANKPLIIAHRGASAIAPENTLAAFARSLGEGADGFELDVRLTRDGVPVVIHDATLRRTGLCEGSISEMTLKELSPISVGDWFNLTWPRLARADYSREVVPTLDQVLSLFRVQYPSDRSAIYIEMKAEKGAVENALPRSVVKLIVQHDLRARAVVVSFDLQALTQIKTIESAVRTGALFEPRRSAAKIMSGRPLIAAAVDCGADEILLHRLIATRRLVGLAAEKELRSVVWTVDDAKWLGRAGDMGIHALITNNPAQVSAR